MGTCLWKHEIIVVCYPQIEQIVSFVLRTVKMSCRICAFVIFSFNTGKALETTARRSTTSLSLTNTKKLSLAKFSRKVMWIF